MKPVKTLFNRLIDLYHQDPNALMIVDQNETLTRKQMMERITTLSKVLPEKSAVGVVLDHGADMIAALFAVLKNGSFYVPAEPTFPRGRIQRMMKDAGVSKILTSRAYADRLEGFDLLFIEDLANKLDQSHEIDLNDKASPQDLAYVLFTSGTTGKPKGVTITNQNVCHYVDAFNEEFHVQPEDRMLQNSVCSFDIFTEEVFASLLNGASLAIASKADQKSVDTLMDFVNKTGCTMLSGFPYLLEKMNGLPAIPSSLRLLISGGDVLRAKYVDHLQDKAAVYNTYGPSETTVCATYFHCLPGTELEDGTFPIGHPVQDVSIELVDEAGKSVKKGELGEIVIYGLGVGDGYILDHGHENDAFKMTSRGPAYRSGDLGYELEDGNLAFVRRKDSQVMIYGKRVEISGVEDVLMQADGIREAVVQARNDSQGLPYLTAYIVTTPEFKGLHELRKQLAQSLTPFLIPEFFVQLSQMPITDHGKPDIRHLPIVLKDEAIPWN